MGKGGQGHGRSALSMGAGDRRREGQLHVVRALNPLAPWASFHRAKAPTLLTRCLATCGSGRRIGMTATTMPIRLTGIRPGQRAATIARCAGARGTTSRTACAAPTASTAFQGLAASTTAVCALCPPAQLVAENSALCISGLCCSLAGVPVGARQRPGYEYRRQPVRYFFANPMAYRLPFYAQSSSIGSAHKRRHPPHPTHTASAPLAAESPTPPPPDHTCPATSPAHPATPPSARLAHQPRPVRTDVAPQRLPPPRPPPLHHPPSSPPPAISQPHHSAFRIPHSPFRTLDLTRFDRWGT